MQYINSYTHAYSAYKTTYIPTYISITCKKKKVHTNTNFECLCTLYVKDLDAFQVSEVNSSAVLRNVAEALMNSELF
jgi:hypothetical protein